jgi:hypothetical protein
MAYEWTLYRDRIELNGTLRDRIHRTVKKDTTILLAARELIVTAPVAFDDYNLVLLADQFDGSRGSIEVRRTPVAGAGTQGTPGPTITLACRRLSGLALTSTGGKGGVGAEGARGPEGRMGRPGGRKPGGPGGDGGPGGPGGIGAVGGTGGQLTLVYIANQGAGFNPGASLLSVGGAGGDGGPGGPGGAGGEGGIGEPEGRPGDTGPQGPQGPAGPQGGSLVPVVSTVSEADYWQYARPLATKWAADRLRAGEYFFRSAGGSLTSPSLSLALAEFDAVLALDPQNAQAAMYRTRLLNNQNILGMAREHDVIAHFEQYETTVTTYEPLIKSLFATATDFLLHTNTLEQFRAGLQREIAHTNGLLPALHADMSSASNEKATAASESKLARQRVTATRARIEALRTELENKTVDWGGVVTLGVVTIAVGVLTLATGGAGSALLPYVPSLLSLAGLTFLDPPISGAEAGVLKQAPDIANRLKDVIAKSKGVTDLNTWKQVGSILEPVVINFGKIIQQLDSASGDPEMIKLLKEVTELTHAALLAEMRSLQADLGLQAADARLTLAAADLVRLDDAGKQLTPDIQVLDDAGMALIRIGQRYLDLLTRYAFECARALEIYTLADLSGEIRYDYGYIHPDIEQDYEDGVKSRADLVAAYTASWAPLLTLNYRLRYDRYFQAGTWTPDSYFRVFDDAPVLAEFKRSHQLVFTVGLADLPQSRYEAKVTGVRLSLVGAASAAPAISCFVEHSGRFVEKRLSDGAPQEMALAPRRAVVQAGKTANTFTGAVIGTDPRTLGFLGRGVASTWTIFVEAEELARKNVDLSGLTRIEVEIEYNAFWKSGDVSLVDVGVTDAGIVMQLSDPAPASGITVALASSDPERVPLPAAVHIPPDSQSITLPITTRRAVDRSRVLLTATHGDVTKRLRL